ncbi:glia maturation factor gamma [Gongronella butleri]|nr:glia maturation factor gamma [Gongronella butleri]
MPGIISTCDIDTALVEKLKEFRFKKYSSGNAAFVLKIDKKNLKIVEDEVHEDVSLEDLVEELPENVPRYVVLSYELSHADGRKQFPLVFIFWAPEGSNPELHMLYTTAKLYLQEKIDVIREFEIRDPEGLTDEYLQSKLK